MGIVSNIYYLATRYQSQKLDQNTPLFPAKSPIVQSQCLTSGPLMKALRQKTGNELIHLHAVQALMLGVDSLDTPTSH